MTGLDWKSDSAATVIHPLLKGNGRIHLNGTGGVKFQKPGSRFRSGFSRYSSENVASVRIVGYDESLRRFMLEFELNILPLSIDNAHVDVRTLLALEDGRYFEGESFGATGTRVGEICFNTAMTGYQEVLTDPSYRGQIVAMTYPLIGNYGINSLDQESHSPHVRGFVIEELTEVPSNWRSEMSLDEYLRKWNIPGAKGIDTRALTRHLRTRGAMKACLTTEEISPEEATQRAIEGEGVIGMDYVREVSTKKIYRWDPEDKLSAPWSIRTNADGQAEPALPPIRFRIAAYDYGIKENILRLLRQKGFGVTVVPATTSAEEALALNPDGIFLSNGPGDPAALALCPQNRARFNGQKTDLRDLSRPSNSRLRVRRIDIQIEIRPSRRQSAGKRFAHRQSGDHRAKSRIRRRSGVASLRC